MVGTVFLRLLLVFFLAVCAVGFLFAAAPFIAVSGAFVVFDFGGIMTVLGFVFFALVVWSIYPLFAETKPPNDTDMNDRR
ncbi:MAG: hypothetical protein RIS44_2349 [Pseudomonadota bacterium]|jgi:uncharacterized membrane protein